MKSKEQKRKEAIERQEHYNSLSTEEKISKLNKAPGKSLKQKIKLS